jgi:hypothetical protein
MVTRRELVTGGVFGALAASPVSAQSESNAQTVGVLREMQRSLTSIDSTLDTAFESNAVAFGFVPKIRQMFTEFMRANFKFPDYQEIGMGVFYDLYDWHIKNNQPLQLSRMSDNRLALRFMFTTMILRQEMDPNHLGVPFDRA